MNFQDPWPQRTTLLNIYTKLKDVTYLDSLIKSGSRRKSFNANGDV